jgi:coenzyme F420-reducing hydrogenase delta subunit
MERKEHQQRGPKILLFATESCAYPGADNVGQNHLEYPTNAYVIRVRAPVMFPEEFYLRCFDKGVGGIIVMSCGHECPFQGAYDNLAARISRVHELMKKRQMDTNRLRLCAICTVCCKPFLKEVNMMNEYLTRGAVTTGEA